MHDWNAAYPTDEVDGTAPDYGPDAKASFQSCFKSVSITNNATLRRMLLAETPVQGQDTDFGRWFHAEALSSEDAYTSA